jgi:hypothetical protein
MKPLEVSTVIAAPREAVFRAALEIERWPERIPDILKLEKLTPGPVVVGTRFRETRKMFGKEATEEMTFAEIDTPNAYTLTAHNCGCDYIMKHLFVDAEGGTRMTLSFRGVPRSLFAKLSSPMLLLMKGMMRKKLQADLDALAKSLTA